jgi:hypothetical protein
MLTGVYPGIFLPTTIFDMTMRNVQSATLRRNHFSIQIYTLDVVNGAWLHWDGVFTISRRRDNHLERSIGA